MKSWKVFLLKYGITGGIGALMAWFTLSQYGFSTEMSTLEQYRILCDVFTIPGMILIMVGFLIMIANAGNFTGLSYAVTHGLRRLIPFGHKKEERYYDYYVRKKEQGKITGYGFIFITGAVFMAVALVFYALFYSLY